MFTISSLRAAPSRKTLRRRSLSVSALALVAGLALSACAGQATAPLSVSGNAGSTGAAATTTLNIVNEAVCPSLDPSLGGSTECRRLMYLSNGYLTDFPNGNPQLAQSITSSNGNLTWTAALRPGLKFSDGSPLTSADVVASFERYLRPPLKGTQEVMKNITSVRAEGPSTVIFTLAQPDAEFPKSITYDIAAIYPADKLNEKNFFAAPVTAGAYAITSANLNTGSYTLRANPYYAGTKPKVTAIDFTTVADGATRLAQVESGQVSYAKSIPADLLKSLPGNLRVVKTGFPGGMIHLVFNDGAGSASVTANVRIRQAINLAVDRQQIASVALGGYMQPLYGVPWADPETDAPAQSRNVQQAKQLLQGTPCQNGCTFKLIDIPDFNWQLPLVSTIVQQNLKDIGINVVLVNTPLATLAKVAPNSWDGAVLDPGSNVMTDASIANGTLATWQWWGTTPVFPDLVSLAAKLQTASASEAPAVKQQIDAQFQKDMPWVPLTILYFLDVTRESASVIDSPIGWRLNVG
jgi:peptide/nickel transport system substrate-binding protein